MLDEGGWVVVSGGESCISEAVQLCLASTKHLPPFVKFIIFDQITSVVDGTTCSHSKQLTLAVKQTCFLLYGPPAHW